MKKFLILLMALVCASPLFAQIDPTVVVDREFQGKIDADVRMPETTAVVADSLKVFDVSFDYSIFDRPFRDLYEFSPHQAASLGVVPPADLPHFSARVASQYPLMPEVDLYGQLVPKNNRNVNFGMFVKFASEKGDIPSMHEYFETVDANRSRMTAGANFKYVWEKGEMSVGAAYRYASARDVHDPIPMPGLTIPRDSAKHSVGAFEAGVNVRSTNSRDHEFYYDINGAFVSSSKGLGFKPLYDGYTFSESALSIDVEFGSSFEEHRMYVDVRSQNNWYSQQNGYYLGIIEFAPIYRYAKGRFDGRFGIRFSNSFTGDNTTTIYPDVDAKFELAVNKLWIRAVANGGREIDNLGIHLENAPWMLISPDSFKMNYTTRPIDAKLSVEGIIGSRLGLNVYGTYTAYRNKMLLYTARFENGYLPYIYPQFVNYAKMSAGAELTWTSKELRVFTSVQVNKYNSESELYMLPKISSLSQIEYNFKERLFLSVAFDLQGKRESQIGQLPEYLDLSAKAEFKINRFISAYVKGGNLLNKENYIFAGIGSMPVNVGGGICIDF